jgi:hypothetical protein
MGVLFGLPLMVVALALLCPLFFGRGGLPYLKWFVMQMDVAAAAAGCWVLLGYSVMRVLADKLFLRVAGDKVRVRS